MSNRRRRVLSLVLITSMLGTSGCFLDEVRRYEFQDLNQVSVSVKSDGKEIPVLPADPAAKTAKVDDVTFTRTETNVDVADKHAIEGRTLTVYNDFSGPEKPSDPKGEVVVPFNHTLASSVQWQTTGGYTASASWIPMTVRTPWRNVRVTDEAATAPTIGALVFYAGILSLGSGLFLSAVGCKDCGKTPILLDVGGVIAMVGGYALTWPIKHERWKGF